MIGMASILSGIARFCNIDKEEKIQFRCEWLAKTVTLKLGKKRNGCDNWGFCT